MAASGTLIMRLHDGSVLSQMNSRDLARLPIWKGNRIMDTAHMEEIQAAIGGDIRKLDLKPYHLVTYDRVQEDGTKERVTEIIDGQHRASIIKRHYETEELEFDATELPNTFQVYVIEKRCQSEAEIIQYFRILNATKAIQWREDPRLAANRYIEALVNKFNTPKKELIRQGKTRAPYVGVDVIREEAIRRRVGIEMRESPEEYAERIYQNHLMGLRELAECGAGTKEHAVCLKAGCLLTIDKKYDWLEPLA